MRKRKADHPGIKKVPFERGASVNLRLLFFAGMKKPPTFYCHREDALRKKRQADVFFAKLSL
jgi:hypothetical protein